MAKPHKKAGRSIRITSSLPPDQLATLCKDAADQCKSNVRLEEAKPGRLVFTVRSRRSGTYQYLTFEVRLTNEGAQQVMASRITHYKTHQQRLLFFIPAGPLHMQGLTTYEQFMQHFSALAANADPTATIAITG